MSEKLTGILTNAGKQHITNQALNNEGLGVKELVFANVPNLNEMHHGTPMKACRQAYK